MGLSTEKKKFKTDFQDQKLLAIFDLQVTSMILTKFQVNWPFCSEVKNRFSRWLPWPPSWISNRNNFILLLLLFLIYKSPQCFLPSFESIGLLVQEKKRKIDFQDGGHGSHLGFPTGTILAILDQQVTLMTPTKLQSQMAFQFRRRH